MCPAEPTGGFRDLGRNRFGWKYERYHRECKVAEIIMIAEHERFSIAKFGSKSGHRQTDNTQLTTLVT